MTGGPNGTEWDAYPPGMLPQPPSAVPAYGPPGYGPGYGPPPGYGPGYGPPPVYGPPPGYGPHPGYGPPPGYPGYGTQPGYGWYPTQPPAWPLGPGRPGVATAAAVLGFVTAGLTVLVSGSILITVLAGEDDMVAMLLVLGLPCAAGLIAGGVRLQARRPPALLLAAAVASVAVLLLAWAAGALTIDRSGGLTGLTFFVLTAAVLPVLTAVFAASSTVREWAAARPEER